jgi:indolepyruvate ferredoxin oxidoreductase
VFRHNPKDTILEMPMAAVALREVSLDDKYALESGRVYLTGVQALVRQHNHQRQRDKHAGQDTRGLVYS